MVSRVAVFWKKVLYLVANILLKKQNNFLADVQGGWRLT